MAPSTGPGMRSMLSGHVVPSPGRVTTVCPLLPGEKSRAVALKAASDFRRAPGSDPWTRELALFWGVLRRM